MIFSVKSKTGRVNLSTQWRSLHIPTTNGESTPHQRLHAPSFRTDWLFLCAELTIS
jgi:hypothetical protein